MGWMELDGLDVGRVGWMELGGLDGVGWVGCR